MSFLTKPFHKFLLLWSGDFISAIGSGLTSFGGLKAIRYLEGGAYEN